ncbi:hypothetical protein TrRE_jg757, partial [Triparma retinervis]
MEFPSSVRSIILMEFMERYAYYAMRSVLTTSYFSAFYFSINVGALLSYILSPIFKSNLGYGACFLVPSLMMSGALFILIRNKSSYSFLHRALSPPSITPLSISLASDFFRTFKFALLMPAFWMLFDQQGSAWVLQAKRMSLPGWLQPEQLGVCNTAFVLAMLPLVESYAYPAIERRGAKVTSLRRMGAGMVLAGVAFVMSAALEVRILSSPPHSVSFALQVPQYLVLTAAEIGVSTTGLEFFYQEAPPELKTASASMFLLTTAVGDVLGGAVYDVAEGAGMGNVEVLFFCGGLMFVVSGVFVKFSMG